MKGHFKCVMSLPPSKLSSFTGEKVPSGSMHLYGYFFNSLLGKKIKLKVKMGEKLYVDESRELLVRVCSENVHSTRKVTGNELIHMFLN